MEGIIAYHNQSNILKKSSSGGAFYALAQEVLRQQGVVFGAAFDSDGMVYHKCVENTEELFSLMGSKYVESRLEKTLFELKEQANAGRKVLFSGTPCQIKAVRKYMGTEKINDQNVLLVDFICHGTPEKRFWQDYLEMLQKRYGKLIGEISFRDKRNGWRNYGIRAAFEKKEYYKSRYLDEYMFYFLNDYLLKDGCYQCPFRKQEEKASDITLADAWQAPKNSEGTSLIFPNTDKGKRSIDEIKDQIEIETVIEVPDTTEISGSREKKEQFVRDYEKWGFSGKLKRKYMYGKKYYINVLKSVYSKLIKR